MFETWSQIWKKIGAGIKFPIFLTVVFGLSLLYGCWNRPDYGIVLVRNQSSENIIRGELNICGQTFYFSNLIPAESKEFRYRVMTDSHYSMKISFTSGITLQKDIGYVTHGMSDIKDELIVLNDRIDLKNVEYKLNSLFGKPIHHKFEQKKK